MIHNRRLPKNNTKISNSSKGQEFKKKVHGNNRSDENKQLKILKPTIDSIHQNDRNQKTTENKKCEVSLAPSCDKNSHEETIYARHNGNTCTNTTNSSSSSIKNTISMAESSSARSAAKSGFPWNFFSNSLFFFASILYIYLALFDIVLWSTANTTGNSNRDEEEIIGDVNTKVEDWTHCHFLGIFAALLIMGNSFIDISIWYRKKDDPTIKQLRIATAFAFALTASSEIFFILFSGRVGEEGILNTISNLFNHLSLVSVHIYLINGISLVMSNIDQQSQQQAKEYFATKKLQVTFNNWGNVLFLIASITELLLEYASTSTSSSILLLTESSKRLIKWYNGNQMNKNMSKLVSVASWLMHATFYVLADLIELVENKTLAKEKSL